MRPGFINSFRPSFRKPLGDGKVYVGAVWSSAPSGDVTWDPSGSAIVRASNTNAANFAVLRCHPITLEVEQVMQALRLNTGSADIAPPMDVKTDGSRIAVRATYQKAGPGNAGLRVYNAAGTFTDYSNVGNIASDTLNTVVLWDGSGNVADLWEFEFSAAGSYNITTLSWENDLLLVVFQLSNLPASTTIGLEVNGDPAGSVTVPLNKTISAGVYVNSSGAPVGGIFKISEFSTALPTAAILIAPGQTVEEQKSPRRFGAVQVSGGNPDGNLLLNPGTPEEISFYHDPARYKNGFFVQHPIEMVWGGKISKLCPVVPAVTGSGVSINTRRSNIDLFRDGHFMVGAQIFASGTPTEAEFRAALGTANPGITLTIPGAPGNGTFHLYGRYDNEGTPQWIRRCTGTYSNPPVLEAAANTKGDVFLFQSTGAHAASGTIIFDGTPSNVTITRPTHDFGLLKVNKDSGLVTASYLNNRVTGPSNGQWIIPLGVGSMFASGPYEPGDGLLLAGSAGGPGVNVAGNLIPYMQMVRVDEDTLVPLRSRQMASWATSPTIRFLFSPMRRD